MGSYAKVRGWFEVVDDAVIPLIMDVINEVPLMAIKNNVSIDSVELYQKGWHVGEPINDTRYVFFGADIRTYYLDFYKSIFKKISELSYMMIFLILIFTKWYIYVDFYGGNESDSYIWKISDMNFS